MSYTVLEISGKEALIRKFLELPGRLYSKKEIMQQPEEERRILEGTHVLSHYFTVFPLLVLDEGGTAVSRAVLTVRRTRKLISGFLKAKILQRL